MFVQRTRACIFVVMITNECNVHIFLTIVSASETEAPGHSLQKINTHDQFDKFDIFVSKVTHTGK